MFAIDDKTGVNRRIAWCLGRLLFLAAAPITVPAHLQWMEAVSRASGACHHLAKGVSIAIAYVTYREIVDFVTDVTDLATYARAADPIYNLVLNQDHPTGNSGCPGESPS